MFKVVFIDDETLVKLGLRSMLNWEEEGFEIEGDASNGSEGLDLILSTKPDLVITDIIMPEMDGIEMMQKAKEQGLAPIFVFLSSYDQFELVKKAMQLGAKDYLLKLKLNGEMLHDMLETVKAELKESGGKTERKQERSVWETEELRKAALKKGLIDEVSLLENDDWNFGKEEYVRIAYIATNIYRQVGSKEERERVIYLETICNLIEDISREFFESYCIKWEKGSFLIFLSEDGSHERSNDLNFMAEAIIDMLMQYSNIRASVGISGRVKGLSNLKMAYLQTKAMQDFLVVEGYGKVLFLEENNAEKNAEGKGEESALLHIENFAEICETLNKEELETAVKEAVEEIKKKTAKVDAAAFYCTRFMCLLDEYLKHSWQNSYQSSDLNTYIKRLYNCGTISEIIEAFDEYIEKVKKFFEKEGDNEQERLVREAKKYIRAHIYDNISLEELAQALYISPGYLSTVFSKYEPIGIANYTNKIKVMEAQQLLVEKRLKVYEVAFKLGYENAGYFAKVFKKYTGCTPKEYRERK